MMSVCACIFVMDADRFCCGGSLRVRAVFGIEREG